ncbi:MAG TPA: hypothetical protein PKI30_04135, partial [Bacillota bacterium]|nr:hypothetical protein [Bacillota bacterium]
MQISGINPFFFRKRENNTSPPFKQSTAWTKLYTTCLALKYQHFFPVIQKLFTAYPQKLWITASAIIQHLEL